MKYQGQTTYYTHIYKSSLLVCEQWMVGGNWKELVAAAAAAAAFSPSLTAVHCLSVTVV